MYREPTITVRGLTVVILSLVLFVVLYSGHEKSRSALNRKVGEVVRYAHD